ncbi:MAG: IPT/TIG domain-containing protein [Terracidiphilus sp.]
MNKPLGKLGEAIVRSLLHAATLFLLISPTLCHAAVKPMMACDAANTGQIPTITSVSPSTLYAGKTYNVLVTGVFTGDSAIPGCDYIEFWFVTSSSFYSNGTGLVGGSTDSYVTVNNYFDPGAYISPTQTMISVTVAPNAPTETDDVIITCDGCDYQAYAPIQIVGGLTITSVTPSGWWAGQKQNITITGTNFLTKSDSSGPSHVTLTDGANAVTLSNVNVISSTQITATVDIPKKAPAETVTLTVTNTSTSGTPQTATASPAPVVLPIPVISWRGETISGDGAKKQTVIVGQPVELTTTPATLPGGFTISKNMWDVPGTDIKSYNGDSSGITINEDVDLKDIYTTFYWLYPDTGLNVTYEYCATDTSGNQLCTSPQATATFKATRPNISLTVTNPYNHGRVNELPVCGQHQRAAFMFYGDLHYLSGCAPPYTGPVGIDLTASGGDNGIYKFVQVLPSDTLSWNGNAPFQCGPYVNVLDSGFPFPGVQPNQIRPQKAYDGPGQALPNTYSSGTRNFHALMYLLWQPPQLSGTSTASIPVPIGYQQWQFVAAADQTAPIGRGKWQQPVTNAAGAVGDFMLSQDSDNAIYGYPIWGSVSGIGSCDPVNQTQEIEE